MFSSVMIDKLKRREGISLIESIIMVLVLLITLGATMQTIFWSLRLQASSRENIGAYTFMNSWFEAFESLPTSVVSNALAISDSATLCEEVEARLGRPRSFNYQMLISAPAGPGVYTITLQLSVDGSRLSNSSRATITQSKSYNRYSSSPAPDNANREDGSYDA